MRVERLAQPRLDLRIVKTGVVIGSRTHRRVKLR